VGERDPARRWCARANRSSARVESAVSTCSLNGLDANVSTHAHRVVDGDDDGLD
jgi:hypothetical protein